MKSHHVQFGYDAQLRQCQFQVQEHIELDHRWRVRILTQEDSIMLYSSAACISPISLVADLNPCDERTAQWSAVLRLCDDKCRRLYEEEAIHVVAMPSALLAYTDRNSGGHMQPLLYWVSTGNLQFVGLFASIFA